MFFISFKEEKEGEGEGEHDEEVESQVNIVKFVIVTNNLMYI